MEESCTLLDDSFVPLDRQASFQAVTTSAQDFFESRKIEIHASDLLTRGRYYITGKQ
jgi:hypothetical protein